MLTMFRVLIASHLSSNMARAQQTVFLDVGSFLSRETSNQNAAAYVRKYLRTGNQSVSCGGARGRGGSPRRISCFQQSKLCCLCQIFPLRTLSSCHHDTYPGLEPASDSQQSSLRRAPLISCEYLAFSPRGRETSHLPRRPFLVNCACSIPLLETPCRV